jgi:hypothetical protein
VCAGPKVPQGFVPVPPVQVAVQSTPSGGFTLSFRTVALSVAFVLTGIVEGGAAVMLIEIVGLVTVVLAVATTEGLSTEAAIIVTGSPAAGTVGGAL